jgi:hypothetical protein
MEEVINQKITRLNAKINESLTKLNTPMLQEAQMLIDDLRDFLREKGQEILRPSAERLITTLRSSAPLTKEDIDTLEKWFVGDVEYYTKLENNFNDWLTEVRRLTTVMNTYSKYSTGEEIKIINMARATLIDLKQTMNDIQRYVEARERVEKFKKSMVSAQLDRSTRDWLADMIEFQLRAAGF